MVSQTPPIMPPKYGIPIISTKDHSSTDGSGLAPNTPTYTGVKGGLTNVGMNLIEGLHNTVYGLTPTIACTAAFNSNLYTLTPFSVSPQFKNYYDYTSFAFVAPSSSTGAITATVVPPSGSVATLKVYKNNGATQATTGDIVANMFYLFYYVSTLDGGAGGFVLK